MTIPRMALLAIALAGAAPHVAAQSAPVRYRAQPDTLWLEVHNPFRLYWIRGDTVGEPQAHHRLDRWAWLPGRELRVEVADRGIPPDGTSRADTFSLSPDGSVLAVNGGTSIEATWDLLPRLPRDGTLTVGRTWTNTLSRSEEGTHGPAAFSITRTHRVTRLVDTLGTRVAVVEGTGEQRWRMSFPGDGPRVVSRWMDVSGPVEERFLVDVRGGRLLGRTWRMHLTGVGGRVRAGGVSDTVPAGLRSAYDARLADGARRARLSRIPALPDSSVSGREDDTDFHLHRARVTPVSVESTVQDSRSRLLHAVTLFRDGRVVRQTWVEMDGHRERTVAVAAAGEGREGETELTPPEPGPWGVAEEGMEEHLAPVLLALPEKGTATVRVWRPSTGAWTTMTARRVALEDGSRGVLLGPSDTRPTLALAFDGDGRLLAAWSLTAPVARMRVAVGAARIDARRALRALTAEVEAAGGGEGVRRLPRVAGGA